MEMQIQNTAVGQFVSTILSSRVQTQILHWQVGGVGSDAAHRALEFYYDGVMPILDDLVESYQGKYSIIGGYSNVDLMEFTDCSDLVKYMTALSMFLERGRTQMPQDSYIQNQIDEITSLTFKTLYRLKRLK